MWLIDETDVDEFVFAMGSNTGFKRKKDFFALFKSWSHDGIAIFYRRYKKAGYNNWRYYFFFSSKVDLYVESLYNANHRNIP